MQFEPQLIAITKKLLARGKLEINMEIQAPSKMESEHKVNLSVFQKLPSDGKTPSRPLNSQSQTTKHFRSSTTRRHQRNVRIKLDETTVTEAVSTSALVAEKPWKT